MIMTDLQPQNNPDPIDEGQEKSEEDFPFTSFRESRTFLAAMQTVSTADKVVDKLTPEHIDKMLDSSAKEDERSYNAFKINKLTGVLVFVFSLAFAIFLLVFFKDSEHFITVLTGIFSFLGGLGIGKFILPGKKE